jgi:hypothetical protein
VERWPRVPRSRERERERESRRLLVNRESGRAAAAAAADGEASRSTGRGHGNTMGRRILNDALRKMVNADRRGNATALLQPISGVMVSFLNIMKHRGMESVPLLTCCLTSCFLSSTY